jgi:DNA replication protein DnaC
VLVTQGSSAGDTPVRYFRTSVGVHFHRSCGDGRFAADCLIAKTDVLLLDDFGLEKMTLSQRNDAKA